MVRNSSPMSRPIGGMSTSLTSDATILPKAPPMMMPTAMSMTLPRIANSRNSLSMPILPSSSVRFWSPTARSHRTKLGQDEHAHRRTPSDGSLYFAAVSDVWITGIGLVTALGPDRETTWRHLVAGLSGIRPLTLFDPAGFRTGIAAQVDDTALPPVDTPRHASRATSLQPGRGRRGAERRGFADRRTAAALGPRHGRWRCRPVRDRGVHRPPPASRPAGARAHGVSRALAGLPDRPPRFPLRPRRLSPHRHHRLLLLDPGSGHGGGDDRRWPRTGGAGRWHRCDLPSHPRRVQLAARRRPQALPAVRPHAAGPHDRRGRGGSRVGGRRPRADPRGNALCPGARLRHHQRRVPHDSTRALRRGVGTHHPGGTRGRWDRARRGRLHQRPRHATEQNDAPSARRISGFRRPLARLPVSSVKGALGHCLCGAGTEAAITAPPSPDRSCRPRPASATPTQPARSTRRGQRSAPHHTQRPSSSRLGGNRASGLGKLLVSRHDLFICSVGVVSPAAPASSAWSRRSRSAWEPTVGLDRPDGPPLPVAVATTSPPQRAVPMVARRLTDRPSCSRRPARRSPRSVTRCRGPHAGGITSGT